MRQTSQIWCPYRGGWIQSTDATKEHVIPLALGGSNKLVIFTSDDNSRFGAEIEGRFERDMFLKLARVRANSQGRPKGRKGKKRVLEYVAMNAKAEDGRSLRMSFRNDGVEVIDARNRIPVSEPTSINFTSELKPEDFVLTRLRFVSKVALSYGVFRYGDRFRRHVDHQTLRELLYAQNAEDARKVSANVDVPIFGDEEASAEGQAIRGLCKAVYPLSCVGLLWTESMKGTKLVRKMNTFVGALGQYIGSVGVEADFTALDDRPDDAWGSFLVVKRNSLNLMSLQGAMLRLQEYFLQHPDRIQDTYPEGLSDFMDAPSDS